MIERLVNALNWVEQGYKIFPIAPGTKIPATPNGFKDATNDRAQIIQWYTDNPNYGVGLPTGLDNNLLVVDCDGDEGNSNYSDPNTFSVRTPSGGTHFYYAHQEGIRNSTSKLAAKVDIRAEGGYVVAPPTPNYIGLNVTTAISVELPFGIKSRLATATPKVTVSSGEGEVIEGGRNDYLTRVAGSLNKRGLSIEAIEAALLAENETRCDPPLPTNEVERIISNISKYEQEDPEYTKDPIYIKASELTESMSDFLANIDELSGEATGIDGLDKMLGGGLRLGELVVLNAPAKTGKSTLLHYIMHRFITKEVPIAYASREMSPDTEVLPNLFSIELDRNVWKAPPTHKECAYSSTWPLYFSGGYGTLSDAELDTWFQAMVSLDVKYYVMDHLHYFLDDPEAFGEVSKLIKRFKTWTKKYNVCIILVVQPPKLQDGQELNINTLRGGASIGQALDSLLTLERVRDKDSGTLVPNIARLRLSVARHKLARPGAIFLQYDVETTKFLEVEELQAEQEVEEMPPLFDRSLVIQSKMPMIQPSYKK